MCTTMLEASSRAHAKGRGRFAVTVEAASAAPIAKEVVEGRAAAASAAARAGVLGWWAAAWAAAAWAAAWAAA